MFKFENYIKFEIRNFEHIQTDLKSKFGNQFSSNDLLTLLVDWNRDKLGSLYDNIQPICQIYNLAVKSARLFYSPPKSKLSAHIDGPAPDEFLYALNIPIDVAEDKHYHIWFSYDGEYAVGDNYKKYTNYVDIKEPDKLKVVDKLTLLEPHFVRIGIPHMVINDTDQIRLILSIRISGLNYFTIREMTDK